MADAQLRKSISEKSTVHSRPGKAPESASPQVKIGKQHGESYSVGKNGGIAQSLDGKVKTGGNEARKATFKAPSDIPQIYGCVFYTDKMYEQTLCTVPTNDDETFNIIISDVNAIDGGTAIEGTYYAAYHTEYYGEYKLYITSYDIATGEKLKTIYGDVSAEATDLAYNPADGKVYGCFCDPDSPDYSDYYFGTIDYSTGVTTRISQLPRQLAAIAINSAGRIYAIDKQQEKIGYSLTTVGADLYEIDAQSGEMTFIGKTGQRPEYRSSACIDPASGRMFWAVSPDDECGYLYEVNLSTGATELIYQFPYNEEIVGMYIPDSGVTANSPSPVTDFEAVFSNGSLDGTVSFTLPTADLDGVMLSGDLTWELRINGTKSHSGTGSPGKSVSVPVNLTDEGLYTFSVTVSNENGNSEETSVRIFVGKDTPLEPVVNVTANGNTINLSWTAVNESVNGGYIDPSKVYYRVTRYPDNVVLAENAKTTSLSDVVDIPEVMAYYYYTVEAKCAGILSKPATSDKVIIGHLTPPCNDDFNNIQQFDFYTVIDANNDNQKWGPYIGNIQMVYNTTLDMDDWLISPPVMLEAGKAYKVSFDLLTGNDKTQETFEVKYGRGNSVADMVGTIIERQSVAHTIYVNYSGFIVPDETGIHYIGIHGCSKADAYTISIDNLSIGSPVNASTPEPVSDLSIVSHTNGELCADISFKAPEYNLAGFRLNSLEKIVVKRDRLTVKTFDAPAPGSTLSFTDEVPECSDFTYEIYATNSAGEGPAASLTVYVGVLAPSDPTNVNIVETGNTGEVTISWDAPATDEKGNALDPQYITYGIYAPSGYEMELLFKDISATSHTFKATENIDIQSFAQFVVVAKTLGGFSDGTPTPMIPVGKPYASPYRESFSHGQPVSILATNSSGGARWQLYNDESGIPSADGDNGFIGSQANYTDDYGTLILGKVDLSGLTAPALTFYTYSITDEEDADDNEIDIEAVVDGTATKITTVKISDYTREEGWIKIFVPLDAFAGKTIQLRLTSHCRSWQYTFVDAIRIDNGYNNNLTAFKISAPEKVKAGTDFELTVDVENNGLKEADSYTVELYTDGELTASKAGSPIASFGKATFTFTGRLSVIDLMPTTFMAKIVYAADEYPADNESESVTVKPVEPTLPVVKELSAVVNNNCISLTWDKPDMSEFIPDAYTETFEDAESWSTSGACGWTFVDRDNAGVGGFNDGSEFPGIATGSVKSFFVFDNDTKGYDDYYNNAHSGSKFLAQLYSYDKTSGNPVACDDWAISPLLCGAAQTVSLYARCYDSTYPETFQILYSTGSTEPEEFILAAEYTCTSSEWSVFNAELPAGVLRMAIRCISNYRFMFFADDVTFIPAPTGNELTLTGYNIYRDGEFATSVGADANSFDDTEADKSTGHSYMMTALYNLGESCPGNVAIVGTSGAGAISAETVAIRGGEGSISVFNAEGLNISVYTPAGQAVALLTGAAGSEKIAAAPGVYIVKVDTLVRKVIVK